MIREILNGLAKRKLANLLIFLQLSLSLTYFFTTAVSVEKVFRIYLEVPQVLNTSTNQMILMEIQNDGLDGELFHKFHKELEKNAKIDRMGTYHNSWLECERMDSDTVSAVEVSQDVDWVKSIEVSEGRGLEKTDFDLETSDGTQEHPLAILLGGKLMEKYQFRLGDSFADINGIYYKIVGVISKDSTWFMQSIPERLLVSLDNQGVVPLLENEEVPMYYYCRTVDSAVADNVKEEIQETAGKYQITLSAQVVSENLKEQFQQDLAENMQWLCFSLVILVMIAVGMTTLITARIYSRKQEIGIRAAVGYSMARICGLFMGEIIVVMIFALCVSVIMARILVGDGTQQLEGAVYSTGYYLSEQTIILGGLAAFCMCMPSIILLFIKFRKIQPRNLIGGKE